jgi:hypothetical protein
MEAQNEVYTDLEGSGYDFLEETQANPRTFLYDYVFHYNHYTGLWSAVHRTSYMEYWNNSETKGVIRSKDINTLIEIIQKTQGNIDLADKLIQ